MPLLRSALATVSALLLLIVINLPAQIASADVEAIALVGDAAPDTDGGTFSLLGVPRLSDTGEVSFFASMAGGTSTFGVFAGTPASTRAVALSGDAAPGTGGGVFSSFSFVGVDIDTDGDVAFTANMSGGVASSGIFVETLGGLVPVLLVGSPAADIPGGTYASIAGISVNDSNEVVTTSVVSAFPPTSGVFVESIAGGSLIAKVGDSVPGVAGATFDFFGNPTINEGGDVAFTAEVSGPGISTSGLFRFTQGVGQAIALEGDAAPGTGGGTFGFFDNDQPTIDDAANVYFAGDIVGGTVFEGFFVGDPNSVSAIVVPGDALPQTGGGSVDSLVVRPETAEEGNVSFVADLTGGTTNEGVFLDLAGSSYRVPIALEGEGAPETGGGTFASFNGTSSPNDSDAVAFQAGVSGGSSIIGIFVPEPGITGAIAWGVLALTEVSRRTGKGTTLRD